MRKKTVKNQDGWALGYTVILMLVCTLFVFAMIGIQLTDYKLTQKERERLELKQAFDIAAEGLIDYLKDKTKTEIEAIEEGELLEENPLQVSFLEYVTDSENGDKISFILVGQNKTLEVQYQVSNLIIIKWQYS